MRNFHIQCTTLSGLSYLIRSFYRRFFTTIENVCDLSECKLVGEKMKKNFRVPRDLIIKNNAVSFYSSSSSLWSQSACTWNKDSMMFR